MHDTQENVLLVGAQCTLSATNIGTFRHICLFGAYFDARNVVPAHQQLQDLVQSFNAHMLWLQAEIIPYVSDRIRWLTITTYLKAMVF
jgi:hypothetical protein